MEELNWHDVYEDACRRFGGQTPGRELEAELVLRFRDAPMALHAAVVKLGDRFANGKIHSPWPLVLRELEVDAERSSVTASDTSERERFVRLAELFIHNAGHVLPTEAELLDELFGERGRLHAWSDDELLRQRMVGLWRERRVVAPIDWNAGVRQPSYADSRSTVHHA